MADFLRSPNYEGLLTVAPSGGVTVGAMYKIQDTLGVAFETKLIGESVVLVYDCPRIVVPKTTSVAATAGQKAYWNSSTGKVTPTPASGLFLCGIFKEDAGSSATTAIIHLKGEAVTAI